MYFPYLRGRQFELIALRELLEQGVIGNKIIPIIEPVKFTPTLAKTLTVYKEKKHECALIINPEVGNFVSTFQTKVPEDKTVKEILDATNAPNLVRAYLIDQKILGYLRQPGNNLSRFMLVNTKEESVVAYSRLKLDTEPKYTLMPFCPASIRYKGLTKILFGDKFEKAETNGDYSKNEDEYFSDDHLYYKDEGFYGFSDYSIVGADYIEKGFAPKAVAIHIVYFDEEKTLRVRHFVSDSNYDYNDPAGKFGEAVKKLVNWLKKTDIYQTKGLKQFVECYETGRYPGLGSVKKYSIMHHLELMNRYLEGEL